MPARIQKADPTDLAVDALAYGLLVQSEHLLKELNLTDSLKAFDLVIKKYSDQQMWDWDLVESFINLYQLEILQENAPLSRSYKRIDEILQYIFNVLREQKEQNRLSRSEVRIEVSQDQEEAEESINLHEVKWTKEQANHLENVLKPLVEALHRTNDRDTIVFLLAIGYVLIFELKIRFLIARIKSWYTQAGIPIEMSKIEEIISIDILAPDGKSDSRHIRNAFAHGRFEILPNGNLRLWDCEQYSPSKINFEVSLPIIRIGEYFNLLQKIVGVIEMHTHFLNAIEILWEKYKPELRIMPINQ